MRTIIQVLLISMTLSFISMTNAKAAENTDISASSQSEAAQIAKQRFGGKILKVQLDSSENPAQYKVKLLTKDGTVKIVTIMASSE